MLEGIMKRYLSRLILENIGLHENYSCDFNDAINVISGPSGTGKSWIIRAIKSVYFNRPSIDSLRRTGSKKSLIKLVYSDGVEIERNLSKSVNRYTLRIPGQDEKVFDSVGKDVPEEIQQIVSAYPIKIDSTTFYLPLQDQFRNQWFLFDENINAGVKNKLFNLLTGNDVLDSLFKDFNKDILGEGRTIKHLEKDLDDKNTQLKKINQDLDNQRNTLNIAQEMLLDIQNNYTKFDKIQENHEKLQNLKQSVTEIESRISLIKSIKSTSLEKLSDTIARIGEIRTKHSQIQEIHSKLTQCASRLQTLQIAPNTQEIEDYLNRFTTVKATYEKLTEIQAKKYKIERQFSELPMVPKRVAEFGELTALVDKLDKVQCVNRKLQELHNNQKKTVDRIKSLDTEINSGEEEFKSVLKEAKVCPLCGSDQT